MAEDLRNYKLQLQQVCSNKFMLEYIHPPFDDSLSQLVNVSRIASKNIVWFPLQVEAALLTDPQNEELLKLKADLEEVIELTQDLIKTQDGDSKAPNIHSSSNDDDVTASLLAAEDDEAGESSATRWRVGEKCLARWKADSM